MDKVVDPNSWINTQISDYTLIYVLFFQFFVIFGPKMSDEKLFLMSIEGKICLKQQLADEDV